MLLATVITPERDATCRFRHLIIGEAQQLCEQRACIANAPTQNAEVIDVHDVVMQPASPAPAVVV
jgi:hypothetical protein